MSCLFPTSIYLHFYPQMMSGKAAAPVQSVHEQDIQSHISSFHTCVSCDLCVCMTGIRTVTRHRDRV